MYVDIICCLCIDTGKDFMTRLEFKQRLSIAIGAAKGMYDQMKYT